MANLFDPPPRKTLPLTKNRDVPVDFKQRIDGVYTNYAAGVTVTLIIDTTPTPTTAVATINGFHAVCKLESTVTDDIKAGTPWRCLVTFPTVPTTDDVPLRGRTSRADF